MLFVVLDTAFCLGEIGGENRQTSVEELGCQFTLVVFLDNASMIVFCDYLVEHGHAECRNGCLYAHADDIAPLGGDFVVHVGVEHFGGGIVATHGYVGPHRFAGYEVVGRSHGEQAKRGVDGVRKAHIVDIEYFVAGYVCLYARHSGFIYGYLEIDSRRKCIGNSRCGYDIDGIIGICELILHKVLADIMRYVQAQGFGDIAVDGMAGNNENFVFDISVAAEKVAHGTHGFRNGVFLLRYEHIGLHGILFGRAFDVYECQQQACCQ